MTIECNEVFSSEQSFKLYCNVSETVSASIIRVDDLIEAMTE
jgi:hypothetical protein